MADVRVGIIGGGPGGLLTAYLLEQRAKFPFSVTIFEASGRVGGKIMTPHFSAAGVRYEAGAAELYDYTRLGPDPLRELVRTLGLNARPMAGDAVILGDRILSGQGDIQRELGEKTSGVLRRFAERAKARIGLRRYYESDWQEDNDDPLSTISFANLLDEVEDDDARRLLEVSVHSDVATEPEKTNALYGLQNYLMNHPDYMQLYSLEGGLERLPRELAARISAKLCLAQPVVAVGRGEEEDTYLVHSRVADTIVTDEFDVLVVALPINWFSLIEWRGSALARAMRAHVANHAQLAHYLRISLLFERPFWRSAVQGSYFMTDALGGSCLYDENLRDGVDPHGVLGWLAAGDAALTLGNFDDATLVDHVVHALPKALRGSNEVLLEGRVHRWLGAVSALPGGLLQREPDSRHVPEPSEHPWLFTVGDYLFDATLNGTLDSADTVVEWILEEVAEYESAPDVDSSALSHLDDDHVSTPSRANSDIIALAPQHKTVA